MIDNFSLERVTKAPASFDPKKLWAFQDHYMQAAAAQAESGDDAAVSCSGPGWCPRRRRARSGPKLTRIVEAAGDRLKVFGDILAYADFFFQRRNRLRRAGVRKEPAQAGRCGAAGQISRPPGRGRAVRRRAAWKRRCSSSSPTKESRSATSSTPCASPSPAKPSARDSTIAWRSSAATPASPESSKRSMNSQASRSPISRPARVQSTEPIRENSDALLPRVSEFLRIPLTLLTATMRSWHERCRSLCLKWDTSHGTSELCLHRSAALTSWDFRFRRSSRIFRPARIEPRPPKRSIFQRSGPLALAGAAVAAGPAVWSAVDRFWPRHCGQHSIPSGAAGPAGPRSAACPVTYQPSDRLGAGPRAAGRVLKDARLLCMKSSSILKKACTITTRPSRSSAKRRRCPAVDRIGDALPMGGLGCTIGAPESRGARRLQIGDRRLSERPFRSGSIALYGAAQ